MRRRTKRAEEAMGRANRSCVRRSSGARGTATGRRVKSRQLVPSVEVEKRTTEGKKIHASW
jgi:hypothetical protein